MPRLTVIRRRALDEMMKEALFEATLAVLTRYRVDGLTMDRVAVEAGVAKASLYRYFRSKQELLEFVYAKLVDPLFRQFEEVAARQQPAIRCLSDQLRILLEHAARHAEVHKLLFDDDTALGLLQSSERRTAETATGQLVEVFRQGMAEGVFRSQDPWMLARMYLGLCKGVLQSQPGLAEPAQRAALHRLILDTFLNGAATENGSIPLDE
ncbi:MAG: TetR/AcrR family transcriptional regulator [Thermoguttaceae bacterium]